MHIDCCIAVSIILYNKYSVVLAKLYLTISISENFGMFSILMCNFQISTIRKVLHQAIQNQPELPCIALTSSIYILSHEERPHSPLRSSNLYFISYFISGWFAQIYSLLVSWTFPSIPYEYCDAYTLPLLCNSYSPSNPTHTLSYMFPVVYILPNSFICRPFTSQCVNGL